MSKTNMQRNLTHWCDWINAKISFVAAILLLVMLIFSGVAIFLRYFLGSPLVWAGDILLAAFVWMSFLGITIAFRAALHVQIDTLTNLIPEKPRIALLLVTQILIVGLSIFLTIEGFKVVIASLSTHSGVLRWPPSYFYLAFPTAFFLISLYGLDDMYHQFRQIRFRQHDTKDAA